MTVTVPVPAGTRGKQLDVVLRKQHIKVGVKGQEPVIEGDMPYEIKVDDSTWTLGQFPPLSPSVFSRMFLTPPLTNPADDSREVTVSLEKLNQQVWWPHVVTTAPKIDTTKITPENSKLSDLDGETRAMVEKMMASSSTCSRWIRSSP